MSCYGYWVCFDCRLTVRRPTWRRVTYERSWLIGRTGDILCTRCKRPCRFLGPTLEVPPKRNIAAWDRLRDWVNTHRTAEGEAAHLAAVHYGHELERRILALQRRPDSSGRNRLIKQLQEYLATVKESDWKQVPNLLRWNHERSVFDSSPVKK